MALAPTEEGAGLWESNPFGDLPASSAALLPLQPTPREAMSRTVGQPRSARGLTAKLVTAAVAALLVVAVVALGHSAGQASREGVVEEKDAVDLVLTSHYDRSHLPCDILHLTVCDCTWASGEMCSRRRHPDDKCWDCCCKSLYNDAYQSAVAHADYSMDSSFTRSQQVAVRKHEIWLDATIMRRIDRSTYEIRYDLTRRREIVPWDRIREDGLPWWQIIMGMAVLALVVGACLSLIGLLLGTFKRTPIKQEQEELKRSREPLQVIDETLREGQKDDRTCTRTCS